MMKRGVLLLTLSLTLVAGSASAQLWREMPAAERGPEVVPLDSKTFTKLAQRVTDSAVNISTQARPKLAGKRGPNLPQVPEDMEEFFQFFRRFGPGQPQPRQGAGSGFIITPDGYILTNNHVVAGMDTVTVQLTNEKKYDAEVIGRDEKTDLALIKIDTDDQLPFAYLGDSDRLEIGEPVVAIGNPFGVGTTMTQGIVSALGRRINAGPYDDFIQTDASINPGNSGGPLFNLHGEVVGINSMIVSRGGGSVGIGFAIPVNMAKSIITQLKDSGHVTRGWLGVQIQALDETLAQQFGMDEPKGALIGEIMKDGPSAGSELKQGDIILEFDGKPVAKMSDLPFIVAQTEVDKKVKVQVWRDGKKKTIEVKVGRMPEEGAEVSSGGEQRSDDFLWDTYGFSAQDITPELRQQFGLERKEGVVVSDLQPGSSAEESGLRPGDAILEARKTKVASAEKLVEILKKNPDDPALLLVGHANGTRFVVLKPAKGE